MTSRAGRIGVLVAAIAVAAILFVVLQGGDSDSDDSTTAAQTQAQQTAPSPPPEPQFDVVTMRGGAPVGGVQSLSYAKGDTVRIRVKLDEQQEDVHIHGYDVEKLNPSGTVDFVFPADIEGIFELEAHGPSGDVVLAEIRVEPA